MMMRLNVFSAFSETEHCFNEKAPDWGFTSMFPLNELAKDSGFLVKGGLKIVAEIKVLKVIGRLDVYGFQVLPSQVRKIVINTRISK